MSKSYRRRRLAAAVVAVIVFKAVGAGAERAASIDYEFIKHPLSVDAKFGVPATGKLRFLAIKAIDGFRVEATLNEPESSVPSRGTLVISVHGSGDRYDTNPNRFLVRLLPARGVSVLAINTRQSGTTRVNTDNFFDIRRDIEAAVYTARSLGYQSLILLGHSLGNIQVQYYAANNWESDIKGVVLAGMFANLPWKSHYLLIRDEDKYRQLAEAALLALREGKQAQILPLAMPWLGDSTPVTAQHFLTYRSEESSAADGTYWIRRVPRPILMVRDEGDQIVQPFEPYALLAAARASGSLVPSIKFVSLPNAKGPNAGGHEFADNQDALADTIIGWLRELRP